MTTDHQPNSLSYDLEASIRRAREPFDQTSRSLSAPAEPVSSTPAEPREPDAREVVEQSEGGAR